MKGIGLIAFLSSMLFLAGGLFVERIDKVEEAETRISGVKLEPKPIIYNLPLGGDETLLIRITLPDNFDPSRKFPVLLGPGLDDGNLKYGCRYFGQNPSQHGWILVESLVHMKSLKAMTLLLDYLEKQYLVEGFHLLGFSANSVPQFAIAGELNQRISSVTAMPGHPNYKDINVLLEIKDVRVLMVVGEKDHWWKNSAINARQKMQEYGLSVNLLVVPDGGHILDEFVGKPLFKELEKLRTVH